MRREHWYNCIKISVESDDDLYKIGVVPYAGTWIETVLGDYDKEGGAVVPYAGTWIETRILRRTGLTGQVVPYAGTWIETGMYTTLKVGANGRSLRGNVD